MSRERIALEVAMFRSLMASVADNCHVHDGPGHSDGRVWRHREGKTEQASEFDYMHLANVLVRVAGIWRGTDPQNRLSLFDEPVAEILAEMGCVSSSEQDRSTTGSTIQPVAPGPGSPPNLLPTPPCVEKG